MTTQSLQASYMKFPTVLRKRLDSRLGSEV
jgi:hypothetical protein